MPCDTVSIAKVAWTAQTDTNLLLEALKALNLGGGMVGEVIYFTGGEYDTRNHRMVVRGYSETRNQEKVAMIKKAYSAEVIKSQARKFRWALKETAPFEYEVVRQ